MTGDDGIRSAMWLLLFILVANSESRLGTITTVLHTYPTQQECQSARIHVDLEMKEAYPFDKDFTLTCQPNRSKHTAIAQLKEEPSTD